MNSIVEKNEIIGKFVEHVTILQMKIAMVPPRRILMVADVLISNSKTHQTHVS